MMKTRIVYEDQHVLVCYKPAGIATQTGKVGQQDMVSELKNYIAQQTERQAKGHGEVEPYVGLVHRLDQPVEGLLVFGKTSAATAALSKQLTERQINKQYIAVVCGALANAEGILEDYLLKEPKTNLSKVVSKHTEGAKWAKLHYRTLSHMITPQEKSLSRMEITLETGRYHQIRVQMAHAGMPLLGDIKYADEDTIHKSRELGIRQVALCAHKLHFQHPKTGEEMEFGIEPAGKAFYLW